MSEYIVEMYDECEKYFSEYGCKPTNTQGFPLREEIVRCRDCAHAEPEGEPPRKGCEGLLWCDYLTEGIGFSVLPHNFCAWAERKEGGE